MLPKGYGRSLLPRACAAAALFLLTLPAAAAGAAGAVESPAAVSGPVADENFRGKAGSEIALLTVAAPDAFDCAHTLRDGVVSTRALVNYAYSQAVGAATKQGVKRSAASPGGYAEKPSRMGPVVGGPRDRGGIAAVSLAQGGQSVTLTRQSLGQIPVCRMWRGPLRALEVSALLRALAAEHPERVDVVVIGVAAQD